jgi:hypothetical protein
MASLKSSVKNFKKQLLSSNNNAIIHNKFVLYFVLIISLLDLFYLSVERDMVTVVIFILVGLLTSFFSKNMLVILVISLTISSILKYGTRISKEGFEEGEQKPDEPKNENPVDPKEEDGSNIYTEENNKKKTSESLEQLPKEVKEAIQKLQSS